MSTPNDPYATPIGQPNPDASEAPEASATAAPNSKVAYGDSAAIAWDAVFEHTATQAAKPEAAEPEVLAPEADPAIPSVSATPELADIDFDDIPRSELSEEAQIIAANSPSTTPAAEGFPAARTIRDAEPIAADATFASAYSATGVTELPESAEPESAGSEATPAAPVRESVLPHGEASPTFTAATAATAVGADEPLQGPKKTDLAELADGEHSDWGTDPTAASLMDLPDAPKSRVGAHIGSIFATLVLIPLAWYLISDSGVRLNLVENNPWEAGQIQIAVLLEFLGAMVTVLLLWLLARASSLGAQLWGLIVAIAGLVAIVVPKLGARAISELDLVIGGYNDFTGNVVHHLNLDLGSGRIAIFGFIIFLTGLMIHIARKSAAERAVAKALRDKAGV